MESNKGSGDDIKADEGGFCSCLIMLALLLMLGFVLLDWATCLGGGYC